MNKENNSIYLDYAASTPVYQDVVDYMLPYFNIQYGNPGSLHKYGQFAIKAIDESRQTLANTLNADFREIIFTGSATEANNLALRGTIKKALINDSFEERPKIIVSTIEHESVLETAKDLENRGADVVYVPVNKDGVVDVKKIEDSIDENTALVSVMYANNEIGTIQPIKEISKIIQEKRDDGNYPLFHTDAVQAFQFLNCDTKDLGVDMMTISGHKIYGPKGVGALYVKNKNSNSKEKIIDPFITGGGQEFGLRSGTENTANIVGLGKAVEYIKDNQEEESERIKNLRDSFIEKLQEINPKAELNGEGDKLPNIANFYFPSQSSEDMLIKLDIQGIAVSSGAACGARSTKQSHVLKALGFSSDRIDSSIRFSFGRPTTKEDIEKSVEIIKNIIK